MWRGKECEALEVYDPLIGLKRNSTGPLPHRARVRAAERAEKEKGNG